MAKKINVNNKEAYNALSHENRKTLEENIDKMITELPVKSGLFLTDDKEKMPVFGPVGGCERIISRKKANSLHSGARIVLTKDNYGSRATGLGGAGGTKCEAIDIVAGQLSCEDNVYADGIKSRANFATDGARIYLTERGNISHYFAIDNTDNLTSISDNLKSGIGIKADHTLVIGRERVRILAGMGSFNGGERLVNGASADSIAPKIELGGTKEQDFQPAVRGHNLVKYIKEMNDFMLKLLEKIDRLETDLLRYKTVMAAHTHVTTGPVVAIPSFEAAAQALKAVPTSMNEKTIAIIETYNKELKQYAALGMPDSGISGTMEDYILSNTVFIGK
jgi:hypothetical protein